MGRTADYVFEMREHGGTFQEEMPEGSFAGEDRFELVGGILGNKVLKETPRHKLVVSDRSLRWFLKQGRTIEIIPLDDYPAPPGLRRYVRKNGGGR